MWNPAHRPVRRAASYISATLSQGFGRRQMFANLSRRGRKSVEVEFSRWAIPTLSYGLSLPTSATIVDFGTKFLHTMASGKLLRSPGAAVHC
jgi:hypothetical protein